MIAVVIPSYRATRSILEVLAGLGPECDAIFVVDDACPDGTGKIVERECSDDRVQVLHHSENQGVGGATMTGYQHALDEGATVIVKIDADGQMDSSLIPELLEPILTGRADYVKGNRFFEPHDLKQMPAVRLIGNALLSFITKFSSGYWDLFDPTNGFTAIHADVARRLPVKRISRRFFFESDLLFRLNTLRAVVTDIAMPAQYGNEQSNLRAHRVVLEFLRKHIVNTAKRIFYNYFLRDFTIASVEIVLGTAMLGAGTLIGVLKWAESMRLGVPATAGTVMLAALPVLIGIQLLIAFLGHDMQNIPREPLQLRSRRRAKQA